MADLILEVYDGQGNAVILDLYENESVSLTSEFTSITDLSVRGGYSQKFRFPWSPRNAAFFGPIIDVNVSPSWFDFKKKTSARLTVDTLPIASGHIQITSIIQTGDAYEIEALFRSEVPNLSAVLGDLKLKDLDYSELEHTVDQDHWNDPTKDYRWSLTDRGQKWSEMGEAGTRSTQSESQPVLSSELTPIINAGWIWRKIFETAGFNYQSEVLDGILNDYWVPYLNSASVVQADQTFANLISAGFDDETTHLFTGATTSWTPSLTIFNDNGSNWSSGVFHAPYSGTFTFRIGARLKCTGDTNTFLIAFGPNGFLVTATDTYADYYQTYEYTMNQGDTMSFTIANYGLSTTLYVDRCETIRLTAASTQSYGFTFYGALNAPDMKQVDFVKSIISMHNLAFIPDKNFSNKIIIEPLASYIGSGDALDFTNIIDINKSIVVTPTTEKQSRNNFWTYKAGGEQLSLYFTQQANRIYGDYRLTQTGNDFATGETKVELEFRSTPCSEINGTSTPIPKFIDNNGAFVSPGPRIMFIGMEHNTRLFVDFGGGTTGTALIMLPILSHYSNSNPTITDYDLNFAPETPLQFITANPFNTLYNLYWRRYYDELYSDESRIMECYVKLTVATFFRLKFSDRIFIRDSWWRLLSINDYIIGSNEPTKCTFAKIVNPLPSCTLSVYDMQSNGTIRFIDSSETISYGNQVCCELNGYRWDADKGCTGLNPQRPQR